MRSALVVPGDALGGEHQLDGDLGAGTGLGDADPLAFQVLERVQRLALRQHQVQVLREQVGDNSELRLFLALELGRAVIGEVERRRAGEAGFHLTGVDGRDVVGRRVGGLRDGDQARDAAVAALVAGARTRRIGNGVGDQAADREIGAPGAAGADAKELHLLGRGQAGRQDHARNRGRG
jgi:hypothetical protein